MVFPMVFTVMFSMVFTLMSVIPLHALSSLGHSVVAPGTGMVGVGADTSERGDNTYQHNGDEFNASWHFHRSFLQIRVS